GGDLGCFDERTAAFGELVEVGCDLVPVAGDVRGEPFDEQRLEELVAGHVCAAFRCSWSRCISAWYSRASLALTRRSASSSGVGGRLPSRHFGHGMVWPVCS